MCAFTVLISLNVIYQQSLTVKNIGMGISQREDF